MYTGPREPQAGGAELVTSGPPLGPSIRVVANKPFDKMDPKSRVNFLKIYTVEHNVKVESFGYVDSNEEWKLISQFNSHWGIPGIEALPPAIRPIYYDGQTHGPAPSPASPLAAYAGFSPSATPNQRTYTSPSSAEIPYSTTYNSANNMRTTQESTESGDRFQTYTQSTTHVVPTNQDSSQSEAVSEQTYQDSTTLNSGYGNPHTHRRTDSHRSERSGGHGKRR